MSASDAARPANREGSGAPALRLIIAYKLMRGAASLLLAALIAALIAAGHALSLGAAAEQIRHHAASAWSIGVADVLVSAAEPRHLWLAACALALDGTCTSLEGWALRRRWWWGSWLVVAVTVGCLPLEAIAIAHHASAGRILLLGLNLAVAAYLARRAVRPRGAARISSARSSLGRSPAPHASRLPRASR